MARAAVVIQPVTSLAADMLNGQCCATRSATPTYWAVRKPTSQRQSRESRRPAEVTVTSRTATQARIVVNTSGRPLHDQHDEQHEEQQRPHQTGLALQHIGDGLRHPT